MSSNNIRNDMTNPSFAEDEVVRGMLNADDLLSNSAISNNNKRGNQSGSPTNEDTSNTNIHKHWPNGYIRVFQKHFLAIKIITTHYASAWGLV